MGAIVLSLSTVIVALSCQTLRRNEPHVAGLIEKKRLTTDPVCGIPVLPEEAHSTMESERYVLYFGSQKGEEDVKKSPQQYLANIEYEKSMNREHYHHSS